MDFHAHTPASNDWNDSKPQNPATTPRQWLLAFMKEGIDCVAVTDHNNSAWIDGLKDEYAKMLIEKPSGFHPLALFPGVELTANGGSHVLAILDPGRSAADVAALMGAVGFQGKLGSTDAVTTKSLQEVCEEIERRGGLAIPAHVDGPKGLFEVHRGGTTLRQLLEAGHIQAWEVLGTGAVPGVVATVRRQPTPVRGSDCHHLTGVSGQGYPGSHYTWIKMGSPSLEGLRLALLDGEMSVQPMGSTVPESGAKLVVCSLTVTDAKYMGRGKSLTIPFNSRFTAIIGSRGSSKSTAVELLRATLDQQADLPESMRKDLEPYFQSSSKAKEGLLTDTTTTQLEYVKDNARFRITWKAGGHTIEELTPDGNWKPAPGDVRSRFPARIYSQKQVFNLARHPLALLDVVDQATGVYPKEERLKLHEATNEYQATRAAERRVRAQLADEPRLLGLQADEARRIQLFETGGSKEILQAFETRTTQYAQVTEWAQSWRTLAEQASAKISGAQPPELSLERFDHTVDAETIAALRAADMGMRAELAGIFAAFERLARQAQAYPAALGEAPWGAALAAARKAYEELAKKLQASQAGAPEDFERHVKSKQAVDQQLAQMSTLRKEELRLAEEAQASLRRIEQLRQDLSARRRAFLDKTLQGNLHVRIRLVQYGAEEDAEADLRTLLACESKYDSDLGRPRGSGLLAILYPAGGVCTEETIEAMRQRLHAIAAGAVPAMDQRFQKHLQRQGEQALERLDTWSPRDWLEVEYSADGLGQDFRPIEAGSPGQKTAALLAFLLTYSESPLILDQPEDDLDTVLINSLIVKQIRERKARRQIVVVTHSPNVVVNGDAELVVSLQARKGGVGIACSGALQEKVVRGMVCEVMEGGAEAFRQRYRRLAID